MEKGRELGLKPLSVAVLAGGHLIAFARVDGASTLRPQIAMGKTGGSLALGVIVVDAEARTIDAVGVTGDTSDHEELCALAGIEAVHLAV